MRRPVRNAFVLGILVGLLVAVVRALRAEGSGPGAVGAGARPLPRPVGASDPVEDRVTSSAVPRPVPEATTASAAAEPPTDVIAPVEADPVPEVPATAEPDAGSEAASWVEPVDGACPPGFPIKSKESSRIFHVPDGAFYARTTPDRCYPTAAAAEADGFRASKR